MHRFDEKWATHPECEEIIIRSSWNQMVCEVARYLLCALRSQKTKMALVKWSLQHIGNVSSVIKEKMAELDRVMLLSPTSEHHDQGCLVGHRRLNTKVFHLWAYQQKWLNTIIAMADPTSVMYTEDEKIQEIAVDNFSSRFQTENPRMMDNPISAMNKVVTDEMNTKLTQTFTAAEVPYGHVIPSRGIRKGGPTATLPLSPLCGGTISAPTTSQSQKAHYWHEYLSWWPTDLPPFVHG
uniref:Uncharacterized protein n=1 Tax=Fagus sylvatica TaxID=28930 RepID=A0A2N9HKJ2_FAGSY